MEGRNSSPEGHCDESLSGGRRKLPAAGRRVPTRETTTAPGRLFRKAAPWIDGFCHRFSRYRELVPQPCRPSIASGFRGRASRPRPRIRAARAWPWPAPGPFPILSVPRSSHVPAPHDLKDGHTDSASTTGASGSAPGSHPSAFTAIILEGTWLCEEREKQRPSPSSSWL